ncbi:hypothetical protein TOTORO_01860 [Serratia phage vB_SmaS-Totoro]|nr:hypothetical protein TOTORO_01860 [Serratia phage vB_SmaS-Totoro]
MSGGKFFYVREQEDNDGLVGFVVVNANGAIMGNNDLPLSLVDKKTSQYMDQVGNHYYTTYRRRSGAESKAKELQDEFITTMLEEMDTVDAAAIEKERIAQIKDRKYSILFAMIALIFMAMYFTDSNNRSNKGKVWETQNSIQTRTEKPTSTSTPNQGVCSGDSCPTSAELHSNTQR